MARSRARGFTLIELVVVLAVVAVLSSIGLPRFLHAFKRARAAEAVQTLTSIERALKEYLVRVGEYPKSSGVQNPTAPMGTKAAFDASLPGWSELDFANEGALWYRYSFTTMADDTGRYTNLVITATGDTDKDGNVLVIQRTYEDGTWVGEFVNDD